MTARLPGPSSQSVTLSVLDVRSGAVTVLDRRRDGHAAVRGVPEPSFASMNSSALTAVARNDASPSPRRRPGSPHARKTAADRAPRAQRAHPLVASTARPR